MRVYYEIQEWGEKSDDDLNPLGLGNNQKSLIVNKKSLPANEDVCILRGLVTPLHVMPEDVLTFNRPRSHCSTRNSFTKT